MQYPSEVHGRLERNTTFSVQAIVEGKEHVEDAHLIQDFYGTVELQMKPYQKPFYLSLLVRYHCTSMHQQRFRMFSSNEISKRVKNKFVNTFEPCQGCEITSAMRDDIYQLDAQAQYPDLKPVQLLKDDPLRSMEAESLTSE